MNINYSAVIDWIDSSAADECTADELDRLSTRISAAVARAVAARRAEALAQATKIAKEFGFDSLDELRSDAPRNRRETLADGRGTRSGLRKPHLDPLDPGACELLAITKMRPENYPNWVKERLAEGFTVAELHFRNHEQGLARLGLGEPRYDAVARHKDLVTQAVESKPQR